VRIVSTSANRLFRGVPIAEDGSATIDGVRYEKSYVDAALDEERCCPTCGAPLRVEALETATEGRP
jgi:hypothetical protein